MRRKVAEGLREGLAAALDLMAQSGGGARVAEGRQVSGRMEVAVAIEMGATSQDIALTVHAHPTLPETLMEAAESIHGKAIHFFQRKVAPTPAQAST